MSTASALRFGWRYAALTIAVAGVAACGTTVPLDQQPGAGQVNDQGLGVTPPGATQPGSALHSGPATVGATTTSGGLVAGGGGSVGLPPGGTTTLPSAIPTSGSGGSRAPIEIGTYYLNGGNAALTGLGFGGLVIPDNKPVFDAFVHYANAHGGLAGRKIKPVYYEYNEGGNPQTQDAAACSTFTQDHHVALVFGGINSGAGELLPCLAQHGVPLIGSGGGGDANYFTQYHLYDYEPDQMNFTTGLQALVGDLKARGYLNGVQNVGVIQYPGAVYTDAIDNGLAPALQAEGLQIKSRYTLSSTTDNGAIASGSTNAELKFATQGIGLVIFMTPGGAAETYFMNSANTQHYKPKYGIWSADSPYVLEKVAPKSQLVGSIGIGYEPGLDVAAAQDPTAKTASGRSCLAFGRSLNMDESGLGNALVRAACDDWWPIVRVAKRNPQALTSAAALAQALDSLGSSYQSASTFAMRFVAERHDEAHGYEELAYGSGCSCFGYVGSPHLTN